MVFGSNQKFVGALGMCPVSPPLNRGLHIIQVEDYSLKNWELSLMALLTITTCGAVADIKKIVKDTFTECTSTLEFVNLFPDLICELT